MHGFPTFKCKGLFPLGYRASFPRPKGPPKLRYMERLRSVKAETEKREEGKGETKEINLAVIIPTPRSPYLGYHAMFLLATKTPCVTAVSQFCEGQNCETTEARLINLTW